jgi:hypothetical protein
MEGSVNTSGVDEGRKVGTEEGVRLNVGMGVVRNDTVGRGVRVGIAVWIAIRVSAKAVLTVEMAVCSISA